MVALYIHLEIHHALFFPAMVDPFVALGLGQQLNMTSEYDQPACMITNSNAFAYLTMN